MNIAQIEKNLAGLVKDISNESFIYDLLLAYGVPKATVTLLSQNPQKLSKCDGQIINKRRLFFQEVKNEDIHHTIDALKDDEATYRHDPRFIVVTDYKTLLAVDTKTDDTLDINIHDIVKYPFFFGPWAKIEKTQHANENPADVKAAEKMAKLYDEISQTNNLNSSEVRHGLNVFFSRLLFCFFAEDTGIFEANSFTNAIGSHTQDDGSDVNVYINKLFEVLNTENRSNYPDYITNFPYVNGGLFKEQCFAPVFTHKARSLLIECGKLDWKDINPDIFGSMFQAVVHVDQRSNMGMHYTSVPNIMKVIEPLFLNELKEEFEKYYDNKNKLEQLLGRLTKLRIFDPACGSGNFLIIAYKETRKLEMKIWKRRCELAHLSHNTAKSFISLSQFYGIELDDFAHEVAILSLWLAEHQMNVAFKEIFGQANPTLPLKEGGKIVCGNATRIPWEDVCPKDKDAEIYILGNPPYLGSSMQNAEQKEDMADVCNTFSNYKNLDYIACWFVKGSNYIQNINAQFAFVSTNSICQGEQVALLWPHIFNFGLEIGFAHTSFKWTNNAKGNAGVTCVIIGIRNVTTVAKYIFNSSNKVTAKNINPYLVDGKSIFLSRRGKPISSIPRMIRGSTFTDGGNFILSQDDMEALVKNSPQSNIFIRDLAGSNEFIKGLKRWCLLITEANLEKALSIPEIKQRIEYVEEFRKKSKAKCTVKFAGFPYAYKQDQHKNVPFVLVPRVASEKRKYITCGFYEAGTVVTDSAQVIYDSAPYIFGILSSYLHAIWVKTTSGCLESRIRYSSALSYNNFPLPDITDKQKKTITTHVYNVLEERENHSDKTMAQLYDPDKMPDGLRQAHHDLDIAVERCYRSKPFTSDEERLEYLFKLYEKMTNKETSGELF